MSTSVKGLGILPFLMKLELFGKNIDPACIYCEYGRSNKEGGLVFCAKKGSVDPYHSCRKFLYAPLKRLPKQYNAPIPKFTKEDFEL